MPNGTDDDPGSVKREAVYREMYNEGRRYRDYEFTSSAWYTGFLLAIFGFLVATRFGSAAPSLARLLAQSCALKLAIVLGAAAIAAISNFLVWYSYSRYEELRTYMTKKLEPAWKEFVPRKHAFVPRYIYYSTPWVVVVLIVLTTLAFAPDQYAGTTGGSSAVPTPATQAQP
jgi:hypothetical protein